MKLFFIPLIFTLVFACSGTGSNDAENAKKLVNENTVSEPKNLKPDTISINAMGDIMFGTNFPNTSKMPPNNGKDLLAPLANYIKNADVVFGNVEGVFLDKGGIPKGTGGQVYCFRQPVSMAQHFKDYGFNLLSVANNHVADFGAPGLTSTDSVLRNLNFTFAGSLKQPTAILEIKGKKIGLAAFAPHKGSVDMNNIPGSVQIVKELKKRAEIVIVSFHGGAEGVTRQRVPKKKEIFFGQDRGDVHDFAHKMIDAGADVIIGHGPHVVRAVELK
jgi:poly-gamma-glutamate capsule biosynthesis protein CapA/YwtB (metallophosphatase superfamily)